ncbi:type VII secretion-associated serine protease mycosin [Streptomyces sp. UH6]|uniref:type VII secretion-associated serine protease mycosin n=1 Tax=Streptomyces sp. UH6 TaxID=2748379 RepID=UPI0015D470C1|nr:type VII secretion-associated serine protease mycosin [Streptomyces sp. UH6]
MTPRPGPTPKAAAVLAAAAITLPLCLTGAAPAAAEPVSGQCTFPAENYPGRPWALQRVLLDELWEQSEGKGVKVAVIDTGVDIKHPQLRDAVDASSGGNFLPAEVDGEPLERGSAKGTDDQVGHGTKVAGIIAARRSDETGFAGLAPEATIIPIKHNDAEGHGKVDEMVKAIDHARQAGAQVINISQDTGSPVDSTPQLKGAVDRALAADIVVVASAGNEGLGGESKNSYPAAYEGVLAVAASDRNGERAPFSQSGDFVDVAAPGVDMVSTVPGGGHCADNGTSFSAPYVAGVAALLRAKHPDWKQEQVVAQIESTAERTVADRDRLVGWGVVDPVRALTEDDRPTRSPAPDGGLAGAEPPEPAPLTLGETPDERDARLGSYVALAAAATVAALAGTAIALRDARRRRRAVTRTGSSAT